MIETISTVAISITTIVVSSLIFANSQIKRFRQWELEDNGDVDLFEEDNEDLIVPYQLIELGSRCIKCGIITGFHKNEGNGYKEYRGMTQPKNCKKEDKCLVKSPHLHCRCGDCKNEWLMRPGDYKEPNELIA